jgi:hypothetical protein
LENVVGDEYFYFLRKKEELSGMIIAHDYEFIVAGTDEFLGKMMEL